MLQKRYKGKAGKGAVPKGKSKFGATEDVDDPSEFVEDKPEKTKKKKRPKVRINVN